MKEALPQHKTAQPVKPSARRDSVFKTIPVDTTKLIEVRIDHKTVVYVKAGTDIEKIKAKYAAKGLTKGQKMGNDNYRRKSDTRVR